MQEVVARLVRWLGSSTDAEGQAESESDEPWPKKEQELAHLIAASVGVMCTFDRSDDGAIIIRFVGPGLADLIGVEPSALGNGASLLTLVHADDVDAISRSLEASANSMSFWNAEYRIAHPTRGERWIEVNAAPRRLKSGILRWHGILHEVTDRKRAQVALRRSEDRFTLAFRNGPTALVISRLADLRVLDANDRFFQLIGSSREEVIGRSLVEAGLDSPERVAERLSLIRERQQPDGSVREVELPLPTKSGEIRLVLGSTQVIELDGEGPCLLSTLVDITERKQAERRLATQHALSRVLANSTSLAAAGPAILRALCDAEGWDFGTIWLVDAATERLRVVEIWHRDATPEAVALATLTRSLAVIKGAGMAGKVWATGRPYMLVDAANAMGFLRAQAVGAAGLTTALAFPILCGDEVIGVVDCIGRRMRQSDDQLLDLFAAIGRQLGLFVERARAQVALEKSQLQLESIIANMHEGLVVSDLEGRLLHWNPAALELHGIADQSDWLLKVSELTKYFEIAALDGKIIPYRDWPLSRILRGERPKSIEYRVRRLDINWELVCSYNGGIVSQSDGSRIAILTITDISDQTRAAEELSMLNADLEGRVAARTAELASANRELEAFSYSVSHDLRAPLRAMNGYADMIIEDYGAALPADGKRMVGVIREAGLKMGQLVDDLLSLSKLGRQSMMLRTIDMAALVQGVVEELMPKPSGDVEVRVEELPPAEADSSLIKQVWVNLIANALKYSQARRPAIIEIGSQPTREGLVYFIKDNGAGFDMRYAHKLFGVFQRLHRADEFEGTGVGLAIVHRIVSRHGGRVWAQAELGHGATFFFTLQSEGLT